MQAVHGRVSFFLQGWYSLPMFPKSHHPSLELSRMSLQLYLLMMPCKVCNLDATPFPLQRRSF